MPESTVALGGDDLVIHEVVPKNEGLSGTKLYQAVGAGAGAAVASVAERSVMGLTGGAAKVANVAAAAILVTIGIVGLWQLRSDSMADRADHRAQVERAERKSDEQRRDDRAKAEDQRREDRADRQRLEELFSRTLDTISRDNRESVTQMKIVSEQMKAATESMVRVEKILTTKMP